MSSNYNAKDELIKFNNRFKFNISILRDLSVLLILKLSGSLLLLKLSMELLSKLKQFYKQYFLSSTMHQMPNNFSHPQWGNSTVLSINQTSFCLSCQMEMVYQQSIADVQLCGAKFLDSSGDAFGVTGYDLGEIIMFSKT